nr:MAG TPA: hypothetical protein [Caudoviricetes sp.]DAU94209.1 MAG TPA: hypothetical protein [Caudoviricetes sp.]
MIFKNNCAQKQHKIFILYFFISITYILSNI